MIFHIDNPKIILISNPYPIKPTYLPSWLILVFILSGQSCMELMQVTRESTIKHIPKWRLLRSHLLRSGPHSIVGRHIILKYGPADYSTVVHFLSFPIQSSITNLLNWISHYEILLFRCTTSFSVKFSMRKIEIDLFKAIKLIKSCCSVKGVFVLSNRRSTCM